MGHRLDEAGVSGTVKTYVEGNRRQQKEEGDGRNCPRPDAGGMLELLEKVDLPEGKEVSVTIIDVPASTDKEAFRRSAGDWKGTVDAETLIKNIFSFVRPSELPVPEKVGNFPFGVLMTTILYHAMR
jgi:predicted DNA-binding antitoxin AbrB/MazE fold protein